MRQISKLPMRQRTPDVGVDTGYVISKLPMRQRTIWTITITCFFLSKLPMRQRTQLDTKRR